jgi:hypothetical protein
MRRSGALSFQSTRLNSCRHVSDSTAAATPTIRNALMNSPARNGSQQAACIRRVCCSLPALVAALKGTARPRKPLANCFSEAALQQPDRKGNGTRTQVVTEKTIPVECFMSFVPRRNRGIRSAAPRSFNTSSISKTRT